MNIGIRNEEPRDYRVVEEITRDAFWDIHVPGCNEHYLVHVMRDHPDFIPELDFVIEVDGMVVGNIMYTKAALIDEGGVEKRILTFGPVSISPAYQRKGLGKKLIERSFSRAKDLGYPLIVIFGNPGNYVGSGFKGCARFDISIGDGVFPTGMLVKELIEGAAEKRRWTYKESEVYHVDDILAEAFDASFEPRDKKYRASQEEFFILSNSRFARDPALRRG